MQSIMNCLRHESADAMNCIEDALRCASHRLNSGQSLHYPADGPPPFTQGRLERFCRDRRPRRSAYLMRRRHHNVCKANNS